MEKIIIQGGNNRLVGRVRIEGAKNAVLPLLAATVLASEGKTTLKNVPVLSDVFTMNNVVRGLNTQVDFDQDENTVVVDATKPLTEEAPYKYVSKMRASIVVLGPILARNGHAKVSMPGGCTIGSRPIDLHLKSLEAMGAQITQTAGYIEAKADRLMGAHIYMDFPSVGATQNIMMAATLAQGTTVIENAAREPEIVDLALLLNKMGAKVRGAGTENITIIGVEKLHGAEHNVVQDRIEAGTFMVAAAMTGGDLLIEDAIWEHNRPLLSKMQEMGVEVTEEDEGIRVRSDVSKLKAVSVKTLPYPGYPTDMQPQITTLLAMSSGTSVVTESIFENRFKFTDELAKMGANIKVEGNSAIIDGVEKLSGAKLSSPDLRAGAALVIAGLCSDEVSEVDQIEFIERGYEHFEEKLKELGADIAKIPIDDEI